MELLHNSAGWDDVYDVVALDEIELCSELIIAASRSDGPMTQEEIDAVLGLRQRRSQAC